VHFNVRLKSDRMCFVSTFCVGLQSFTGTCVKLCLCRLRAFTVVNSIVYTLHVVYSLVYYSPKLKRRYLAYRCKLRLQQQGARSGQHSTDCSVSQRQQCRKRMAHEQPLPHIFDEVTICSHSATAADTVVFAEVESSLVQTTLHGSAQ